MKSIISSKVSTCELNVKQLALKSQSHGKKDILNYESKRNE